MARRCGAWKPAYAVKLEPHLQRVGVLMEPTTVVAKAWEQVERVGARSWFEPRRALVTGAGPIGLLAALLGTQRGLEVHVLDRVTEGPKPALVRDLGAAFHAEGIEQVISDVCPDVVIEATGASELVFASLTGTAPYGVVCLTGVSPMRPQGERGRGRHQQGDRAGERRGRGLGQRQPAPLPPGCRRAGHGRPVMA